LAAILKLSGIKEFLNPDQMMKDITSKIPAQNMTKSNTSSGQIDGKEVGYDQAMDKFRGMSGNMKLPFGMKFNPDDIGGSVTNMMKGVQGQAGNMMKGVQGNMPNMGGMDLNKMMGDLMNGTLNPEQLSPEQAKGMLKQIQQMTKQQ